MRTQEAFDEAFAKSYTISQLFLDSKDRPAPVPLTQFEQRRQARDMQEIAEAAKRRGHNPQLVQNNLESLTQLLPNLINLHKLPAKDWVTIAADVNGAASKLISLKAAFPRADMYKIIRARPRLLLQSDASIAESTQKVRNMLAKAEDVDAIIEAVPELIDSTTLARSLSFLKSTFPTHDPVELLQENPQLLLNLGESNMEDNAEYGEHTTKH